jgi:hypothetical protein
MEDERFGMYYMGIRSNERAISTFWGYFLQDLTVIECVIPKGSHYYYNTKGEYVSNAIKVVREANIEDYLIQIK